MIDGWEGCRGGCLFVCLHRLRGGIRGDGIATQASEDFIVSLLSVLPHRLILYRLRNCDMPTVAYIRSTIFSPSCSTLASRRDVK